MNSIIQTVVLFFSVLDLKYRKKGLMSFMQYWCLGRYFLSKTGSKILVFGLGYDSFLWKRLNGNGKTIFLEDIDDWISQFRGSGLDIRKIKYNTKVEDGAQYGFYDKILELNLDDDILNTKWDIILVDGPLGHQPPRPWAGPGRMSSLFMAHKLSCPGTTVIVDDYSRPIEKKYSTAYFGNSKIKIVQGKLAFFMIGKS